MSRYLVFQLYAPLASWGEAAVGEMRHSAIIPSRSALLGLLAAALGIKRDEEQRLSRLNQHYLFAVRPLSYYEQGIRDYHTIEVPKENKKRIYYTRKDELTLAPDDIGTQLSFREYRCDAYYHIAIKATPDAPYNLEALAEAIRFPVFPLYAGRKSCPLALPLAPKIVAGSLGVAFSQMPIDPLFSHQLAEISAKKICYWEGDAEGVKCVETQVRSDQPLSRQRWQFTSRTQRVGFMEDVE
ncbi:type I-E CRISPR-associated protein Cas5/CasD [Atlantibacter hermannii]|nr:type I-E CRISPR-associated protein Cas5/CasD [Atlantibacter hermannii]NBD01604.1 type I-E CRISPR-associated protein Cas5/CasD [Atlantibacter hermannii]